MLHPAYHFILRRCSSTSGSTRVDMVGQDWRLDSVAGNWKRDREALNTIAAIEVMFLAIVDSPIMIGMSERAR